MSVESDLEDINHVVFIVFSFLLKDAVLEIFVDWCENGCNVIITYALLLDCKHNYITGSSLFVPFKRKDVVWEIFMDQYENGYVIITWVLMAANIYIYIYIFTIHYSSTGLLFMVTIQDSFFAYLRRLGPHL